MLYELATIPSPLLSLDEASKRVQAWVSDPAASGELLGCWRTDVGTLGRLLVLCGFDQAGALAKECERTLLAAEPFGATPDTAPVSLESYAPFPFVPSVRPVRRRRVYEFRTHRLGPGGLAPTLDGWERAVPAAPAYTSHLVVNTYGLDGEPRITHIWGSESLEERSRLRREAYAAGVWPPPGGPEQIVQATSMIGVPDSFSPLC